MPNPGTTFCLSSVAMLLVGAGAPETVPYAGYGYLAMMLLAIGAEMRRGNRSEDKM